MDRYGNVFYENDDANHAKFVMNATQNFAKTAILARGKTNHSSLCAGREVICAGTMFFWKGQLLHIDNASGHYAPKRDALYKAVQIVVEAGANPDYLRAMYITATAKEYFKARTFLANGAANWPEEDQETDQMLIYSSIPGFQA